MLPTPIHCSPASRWSRSPDLPQWCQHSPDLPKCPDPLIFWQTAVAYVLHSGNVRPRDGPRRRRRATPRHAVAPRKRGCFRGLRCPASPAWPTVAAAAESEGGPAARAARLGSWSHALLSSPRQARVKLPPSPSLTPPPPPSLLTPPPSLVSIHLHSKAR